MGLRIQTSPSAGEVTRIPDSYLPSTWPEVQLKIRTFGNPAMNLLTTFVALLLLVPWVVYPTLRRKRVYSSSSEIKRLLKPADASMADLLSQRAFPNQRLVHAFGITNTFVSSDLKVHHAFLNKARLIISELSSKGESWRRFKQTTDGAIAQLLPAHETHYATFIQCLTLRIILVALFKADPESSDAEDLCFVIF